MKDNDKVTLSYRQLKKLVSESGPMFKGGTVRSASYDVLMKRAGTFDHISSFSKDFLDVFFDNLVLYWKENNPSPGYLVAIDDGRTVYLNIEPFDDSIDKALRAFKKFKGPSDIFKDIRTGAKNVGIIRW